MFVDPASPVSDIIVRIRTQNAIVYDNEWAGLFIFTEDTNN